MFTWDSMGSLWQQRPLSSWAAATAVVIAVGYYGDLLTMVCRNHPRGSNYRAAIDLEQCIACGICIEHCHVHAITEEKELDGFTYHWHQAKFDPVSNETLFYIHFKFDDGSRMDRAFFLE